MFFFFTVDAFSCNFANLYFQNGLSIRWRCKYRWLSFPKRIGNLKIAGRGAKIIDYTSKLRKWGVNFTEVYSCGSGTRLGNNVVEIKGAGVGNLIYLLTGIESTSRTIREYNASNAHFAYVHVTHVI